MQNNFPKILRLVFEIKKSFKPIFRTKINKITKFERK